MKLGIVALCLFLATTAGAQTLINVDTGQGTKSGAAVLGSTGSSWNQYYPVSNGTLFSDGVLVPLLDDSGNATGAGMLMYNVSQEGNIGWGDEMFDWYLAGSGANLLLKVTNAPIGFHTLVLYGHGVGDSDISIFDVVSGSTWYGVKSTGSDPGWNDQSQTWVEGQNFVKFDDLVIPSGGEILIEVRQNAAGASIINGFQLEGKATPSGDHDADGLTSIYELANSLDPMAADSDFDGVPDGQELNVDGTSPTDPNDFVPQLLTLWSFDDAGTWNGNGGQTPLVTANLTGVTGQTNGAVELDSSGGNAAKLIYRRVESNAKINATPNNGTFRFLFQPNWSTSGGGPGSVGRLIDMGSPSEGTMDGSWTLYVTADGSALKFVTRSEGLRREHLSGTINWSSGQWYEVLLEYTPTGTSLQIDGSTVATGSGVNGFIKLGDLSIGSDGGDGNTTPAQWNDDPCFSDPATLWEWDDQLQDYVAGYWTGGAWTPDPAQTHPDTYFRDALDQCFNTVVNEAGYWQGSSDGQNHSAQGSFDELATFNYSLLTPPANPPTITGQPASQNLNLGDALTLTVAAASASPLTYHWHRNGTPISGATNASHVVANAALADAGLYVVAVANEHGLVVSDPATVTVVDPDDPDGDGLTNAAEMAAGTNPNLADSDNDGIPDSTELALGLNATTAIAPESAGLVQLQVLTPLK